MSYENEMKELQALRATYSKVQNIVNSKAENLRIEQSLLSQSQIPSAHPRDVEKNLSRSLGPFLAPGNVGDINKIIWPYYFTTNSDLQGIPTVPIALNQTLQTGFRVTQEAAFIWMSFTRAVYQVNGAQWLYLNPNDEASLVTQAPGLTFTIQDASSSRQYFNTPMQMGQYGNPRFPTKFPRPVMLLPNQEIEVQFTNTHPTNIYVPFITAFGYRMRIEDVQQFLGLVYA